MKQSLKVKFLTILFSCFILVDAFAKAPVVEARASEPLTQPIAQALSNDNDKESKEDALVSDDEEEIDENNGNGGEHVALLNQVQSLQQEIQELRGQLEIQAHDLKLLQQQQVAFYKDIDNRLKDNISQVAVLEKSTPVHNFTDEISQELASNIPTLEVTAEAKITKRDNPADEQIRYLAAYDLITKKQFKEALQSMQTFVEKYPQSGYIANAQYWLGELYLTQGDYPKARERFQVVLEKHPKSSKFADSMLKLGYTFAAEGNEAQAIHYLTQVRNNYPDTSTARLAANKLKHLHS